MLSPINRPQEKRDFLVYDLEWKKGRIVERGGRKTQPSIVTLVGVWDRGQYRCYRTVAAFLEAELSRGNNARWFYAHAGGLADMLFILEELFKHPEFTLEASFSGSSAIVVRVKRGKRRWTFVDSYWLLRDKLANIARSIGREKGEVDFQNASEATLREYNADDCSILYQAIEAFEERLLGLGGELQMTLASTAMNLFRRKYLTCSISTDHQTNMLARQSYTASRVEVFSRECTNGRYYDVNSSFPYAMTFEAPGQYRRRRRDLPSHDLTLADVSIEVPEMNLPPLPWRHKARVYFPTGKWRAWMTGVDLRLLQTVGGRILKLHECLEFYPFTDLGGFATQLYEQRVQSKDAMSKLVFKLLLNSLYGKFGEKREKTSMIVHPDSPLNGPGVSKLKDGIFLVERDVDVQHEHVPVSAHITAIAREVLYNYMAEAEPVHYCDTDGFATTGKEMATGKKLGELKHELDIVQGHFYQPKVYSIEHAPDENGRTLRSRAKGFTLAPDYDKVLAKPVEEREKFVEQHSYSQLADLTNGHSLEMVRFFRIKELLRTGEFLPGDVYVDKRLQGLAPKRCFDESGSSRPWSVTEILETDP